MVGVINANESSPNTFQTFKAKALGTASTPTTPTTSASGGGGGGGGTPTSSTSPTSPTQSKGAAPAQFAFQAGGGIGMALVGVALGLVL